MKYLISFSIILGAIIILTSSIDANTLSFITSNNTATTSIAYMTPGTGTTTDTFDTEGYGFASERSALLTFQFTASGTAPILKMRLEYSQNGVDWYPESNILTANATSTYVTGSFKEYVFAVSTTTTSGITPGSGTTKRIHQSLELDVPTRYVRAIYYLPAGTSNGGIWSQFIGTKQNR